MAHSVSTGLFFILTCSLWVAKARQFNSVLFVPNGGRFGEWGPAQFCYKGHAVGFRLKVDPTLTEWDATALNGISLFCNDGRRITSTFGP
ncbi:hypothetical protein lerEdw1_006559 [Lerista edwardsae]|nr:hypothetical protein lerEdw1_006559 [Lerista edwardsae]